MYSSVTTCASANCTELALLEFN